MLGHHVGKNPAAHKKFCRESHEARFGGFHQVIENTIGHRFVKSAFVAEGPDLEFEAF